MNAVEGTRRRESLNSQHLPGEFSIFPKGKSRTSTRTQGRGGLGISKLPVAPHSGPLVGYTGPMVLFIFDFFIQCRVPRYESSGKHRIPNAIISAHRGRDLRCQIGRDDFDNGEVNAPRRVPLPLPREKEKAKKKNDKMS